FFGRGTRALPDAVQLAARDAARIQRRVDVEVEARRIVQDSLRDCRIDGQVRLGERGDAVVDGHLARRQRRVDHDRAVAGAHALVDVCDVHGGAGRPDRGCGDERPRYRGDV